MSVLDTKGELKMKTLVLVVLLLISMAVTVQAAEVIAYIQIGDPLSKVTTGDFGSLAVGKTSGAFLIGVCADRREYVVSYTIKLSGPFFFEDGTQLRNAQTQGRADHIPIYFKPSAIGPVTGQMIFTGVDTFDQPLRNPMPLKGVGTAN
jgi:hypothetical protein